ncbi:MAG: GxxExxY protein [Caulobacteraceae bacterium]|nr:GxxExxY protein [Caulobacteraceae bacterium]
MAETPIFQRQARQGRQARQEPSEELDQLARIVIDAGLAVHRALGPGLLENVYEQCLAHELATRSVATRRQVTLPVTYKDVRLDAGYRVDLLVADAVVVEIKSVEALSRLHQSQILTYLRLSGFRLGLLLNFNVSLFRDGVRRFTR